MGITDTETYLREQLLDAYLEAFINRACPDNIDTARIEIESTHIDSLTKEEVLTKNMMLSSGLVVVYDPNYDDFIIETFVNET